MNLQNIKNFIYNNAGYIALYNALIGLLLIIYTKFDEVNRTVVEVLVYIKFDNVNLSYFNTRLFNFPHFLFRDFASRTEVFTPIFYIILIIGATLFINSKRNEHRLLQFGMAITFISSFISLFIFIVGIIIILGDERLSVLTGSDLFGSFILTSILQFVKTLIMIAVSYIYLKKSREHLEVELLPEDSPETLYLSSDQYTILFKRASKGKRFIHYLIDIILIILIFSPILMRELRGLSYYFEYYLGERIAVYAIFFINGLIYYGIFEGFFRATPGKYITSCIVTGYASVKVKGAQILGRTFSRRIPFEAFSFFGESGWHDTFTETTVSHYKSDDKYKGTVAAVLITAAVLILIVMITNAVR